MNNFSHMKCRFIDINYVEIKIKNTAEYQAGNTSSLPGTGPTG